MKKKSPKSKKKPLPKVDENQLLVENKSQLLEEDENQLLELSPIIESASADNANSLFSGVEDEDNLLEIPELFTTAPNTPEITRSAVETSSSEATNGKIVSEPTFDTRFEEVESEIASESVKENNFAAQAEDKDIQEIQPEAELEVVDKARPQIQIAESGENQPEIRDVETSGVQPEKSLETEFQTPVVPETVGETARKSGLAYGAALTLFGSVIFMLVLGYFADRIFGTSPWGIIIGIVLGAAIGFFQFFRITSQIFKNKE